MAVLTDAQSHEAWRNIFIKNAGQEFFKKLNPACTNVQIKAAFQAIEDFWETNKGTLKGNMDTAAGVTLTNSQAKVLGRAWLWQKARRGN